MARGDHTLSSGSPRSSTPGGGQGGSHWTTWVVLAMVVLALFRWLGSDEPRATPAIEVTPAAGPAAAPVADAASAPSPARPRPPIAKLAQFESAQQAPDRRDDRLVIGGGEVAYETVDSADNIGDLGDARVFTMNFDTGIASGDPRTADVYVLFGSLKLKVADIDEDDALYASILSRGDQVNAYFNFATSERGPPADEKKRRVIVVGDLEQVGLPAGFGNSTTQVKVLDLNPSERSQHEYELALQQYHADIAQYQAILHSARVGGLPVHPEWGEFHGARPTEVRPPAYHPTPEFRPPVYHPPPPHPMRP